MMPLFTRSAILLAIALLTFINSTSLVHAHCPLCTAAAAIGVATVRYYGIDDIITGLWLGAFVLSMALWSGKLVKKYAKKNYVPFQSLAVVGIIIVATVFPFYAVGFFNGMPGMTDTILGINRLAFGTLIGAVVMLVVPRLSNAIKKKGIVFPYQTMAVIFGILLALSIFFQVLVTSYAIV